MGKKQHSKDRMHLTATEWREEWGGFKQKQRVPFKRLPFHCCAITFTPFEDPVCTEDGTVYDVVNVVPYVMKHKRHPVTGQPLALKDLIKLNFYKNTEGLYSCPVTGKVFTEHTHIVAVRPTGNVYANDAVQELNRKPKNWKDLLTDEPFTQKDIIHIQDPMNLQGRTIENFDHVQHGLAVEEQEEEAASKSSGLRNASEDMKRTLGALHSKEAKAAFERGGGGKRAEAIRLLAAAKHAGKAPGASAGSQQGPGTSVSGAPPVSTCGTAEAGGDWRLRAPERSNEGPHFKPGATTWDTEDYTTAAGKANKRVQERLANMVDSAGPGGSKAAAAASAAAGRRGKSPKELYEEAGHVKYVESATTTGATSRSFTSTATAVSTKTLRQLERMERNPKTKGYVRLHTSLGDLNIELHCDIAPRTCENFLGLAGLHYYDGTVFHRSIKNFMIQGGDPTATGKGGESIYGPTFKDELDSRLVHNGRGLLSMANSGKDTNGSQFFITYKSCRHLDFKHSVFGRVVGGLDTLTAMERVPTDKEDRPLREIKITGITIFTNPYEEMEKAEAAAAEAQRKVKEAEAAGAAAGQKDQDYKVGKWFSAPGAASSQSNRDAPEEQEGEGGVGKYISKILAGPSRPMATPAGPKAADQALADAAAMPPPPAKKAKTTPAAPMANFDAW